MMMDDLAKWFDRRYEAINMNTLRSDQPRWISWTGGRLVRSLEWIQRVIFCHHNADILVDMEHRLSCLLDHATGGRASKAYYDTTIMCALVDDHIGANYWHNEDVDEEIEIEVEEAVDEALHPYTVLQPVMRYTDALGRVLWWVAPRGFNIGAPRACFVGTPHDDMFPQMGGLFYTLLPADVTVDDPEAKAPDMRFQNSPEIAGTGIDRLDGMGERLAHATLNAAPLPDLTTIGLVGYDAAPAVTRGAAEGFAGDADAPR